MQTVNTSLRRRFALDRPWPYASIIYIVLLFRGVSDPLGDVSNRVVQPIVAGVGFMAAMAGIGLLSRWLAKHRGWPARAADWAVVGAVACFGGLVLGYAAVVENIGGCGNASTALYDCDTSIVERFLWLFTAAAGWVVGVSVALHHRSPGPAAGRSPAAGNARSTA